MNTQKVTREYRMNQWLGIIRECRDSGQTVSSWCREHDINTKSYYYWLRKIRTAACNDLPMIKSDGHIVPLGIQKSSPSTAEDLTLVPSETVQADITLRMGTAVLEVRNSANASLIENMIKVLLNAR